MKPVVTEVISNALDELPPAAAHAARRVLAVPENAMTRGYYQARRSQATHDAWNRAFDASFGGAATSPFKSDAFFELSGRRGYRDAIRSLFTWPEDSALMLDMPVDAVRLLAASGHHPAVLMLPACIALSDA